MFGLHPALAPLYPMWDAGTLAAVHAVGQQDPTRSHFEAMAEMERAAPSSSLRTGWIDRTLGATPGQGGFQAVQVGSPELPTSLIGPNPKFAIGSLDSVKLAVDQNLVPMSTWRAAVTRLHRGARPVTARPLQGALDAVSQVQKAARSGASAGDLGYPGGGLGQALHDVAQLIKANLGLRVATLDYGNWDMHDGMGTVDGGWMVNQLTELSGAMAAFATELGPDLDRVTLITLSEFGRRVQENGSQGLDHGHGNAVLIMGGGVRGGKVYGRWPGLADLRLDQGDLAGTTDYRSIVTEVLQRRLGVGSVSAVFPGFRPQSLGMFTPV
jgi:uncharacterized protein (DUF1501 family)